MVIFKNVHLKVIWGPVSQCQCYRFFYGITVKNLFWKQGSAEIVLPSTKKSWTCHRCIRHSFTPLVWVSQRIRCKKTAVDCWGSRKDHCVHLPSLQDLYDSRVKKRAGNITDPSHPGHNRFTLLPSGRCYRSLCTRTSRHKNSPPPCHLQPKQPTRELLPVFCNSFPISNYWLSLNVNTYGQ